jgi:hypothetical protein
MAAIVGRINRMAPLAKAKWGLRGQLIKTVEELAELQVQIAKNLNGSPTTRGAIIDEIADAFIMVTQLRALMNAEVEVDERIAFKLDRTEQAINRV